MKTRLFYAPTVAVTAMVIASVTLAVQSVFAANGTALYFNVVSPSGTGSPPYDMTNTFWATTERGTSGGWVSGDQMTFGTNAADTNYPPGTTFSVNLDSGNHLNGIVVNTTNATITLYGGLNTFLDAAQTWWVTNGSTLIDDDTWSVGLNFNSETLTLLGGGTFTFQTPIGNNDTLTTGGLITENNAGGTVNLEAGNNSARNFAAGYTLTAGTLNFAAPASATAFIQFTNGPFSINGGIVDNTSGSAMTLSVGGKGYNFGGNFTFNGSSSLNFGTAPVALAANSAIAINANTLTIGGVISGTGFGLTELGNGNLTLSAVNTYSGNTFVNGGTLALINSGSVNGSANVAISNATLDMSGLALPNGRNSAFSLTNATLVLSIPQTPTTNEVATTLNLGGTTNVVNIVSLPVITSYPTQFPLINYTTLNGAFNIGLGTLPSSATPFAGYLTNINGLVELVLTTGPAPARSLTWIGTDPGNPNNWDVQTSLNWETNGGPPTTYNQGDIVTFNDSATGQTNIYLTASLTPAIMTVSNSVLIYDLGVGGVGGSGEISGSTALTKTGTNLLILDDTGGNNFTGGLIINAGSVQLGVGDGHGSAGAGTIADNGALAIDKSANDASLINDISGSGTITDEGGDTLQLAGTNTFSGSILVVSNSTLQLGSANALSGAPVTTISNGSILDLNGFTAEGVIMVQGDGSGSGAVINSANAAPPGDLGMTNLTLTGNTTVGTTVNRFDIRSPGSTAGSPFGIVLSTGGQPYNLTKSGAGGSGTFALVSVTVDPALANIDIQQGDFQMAGNTTGLGNPNDTLTIENGATFELYSVTNQINKVIVFNDGGTLLNTIGANTIAGPMNITNSGGSADCLFDINGTSLILSNTLTGNGTIFTESGTNAIYFNGNSPAFAGGIYQNAANTLVVDGVLSNGLTIYSRVGGELIVNGQLLGAEVGPDFPDTIAGNGDMNLTVDSSGPIYPGSQGVVGTLTVSNLILDGSSITFDVGPSTTPGSNDLIVATNLTVNNATINVNPMGLLQTGVPYPIFTYSGTLTLNSSFNVIGSGGYTYTIDTSSTQGVVNLIASGGPPIWNGGSANDSDWSDSNNWDGVTLAPGDALYFGGNNRLNNTNDTASGTTYSNLDFQAGSGAFVLNGNAVALVGNSVVNNSAATQTINLPLAFGTPQTFNAVSGPFVIGGGLTNTASTTSNFLTLTGTGILTNLLYNLNPAGSNILAITGANADWTLVDNPSSTPMTVPWALEITNGTLNFGNAGSAPSLTSLTIHNVPSDNQMGLSNGGTATLNMTNGTLTLNTLNTGQSVNSTSIVNVAGGTIKLGPIGSVAADYFQGANGENTGEVSVVTISGGTMNMGISGVTGPFYVTSRGNGTLTLSGSGTLNCATLDVSRNAQGNTFGSVGVVNLNGGTLTANRVGTATDASEAGPATDGINPSATFRFNGGTLRAGAGSATFYQGSTASPAIPITSIVTTGGAILDSSNFSITVLEPLQHDSALGATPDGGLTKLGSGALTLTAASTYTGNTTVSNGTLAVNGSLAATAVTVETNATLAGTGSLGGTVTVNAGGAVAPGGVGVIGTLTVTGNVGLGGNAEMSLNATTPTNAVLVSSGSITYGGTLTVTNISGTLALSNSFTLFKASGLSGTFSATNLPALSAGLAWNWNPANGTLSVIQASVFPPTISPDITSFSLSGGNVVISGTNGQAGATYYLLTSTNLEVPISQWTAVSTNVAAGNNFTFTGTNAIVPADPQQFYILSSTNN